MEYIDNSLRVNRNRIRVEILIAKLRQLLHVLGVFAAAVEGNHHGRRPVGCIVGGQVD